MRDLGETSELKEHCGVFGVFGHAEAANLTYLGLHALQHRGQEAAGIVSTDGTELFAHRAMGLVADAFDGQALSRLSGDRAIGHVRYATAGPSAIANAQPLLFNGLDARHPGPSQRGGQTRGPLALAHNGNLVNAAELQAELEEQGSIFQSTSDTEVIGHLIAREREGELPDRIEAALRRIAGAYSLLFLSRDQLIGVRDPLGFRPLVVGRVRDAYVLASETCALDLIEAEYLCEVEPGEMVILDAHGLTRRRFASSERGGRCVFEHIYFARPDTELFGQSVYEVRKRLGRELAREQPAAADVVVPVPDSGVAAAIGYAEALGVRFDLGLVRSHYVGRTFIEPQQSIRHFGVKIKLNAVRGALRGKRVVVVDDSLVRGTTSRKIVGMLRAAGAAEVHLRISAPPTLFPCYYGIDTPTKQELIASNHTVAEIARFVTADSLGYLSQDGIYRALERPRDGYCDACFSGDYLVPIPEPGGRLLKVIRK
ncbi:MAG: amidophosphoribosyltransferase [Deltaproteobacteria bacterium]